MSLLPDLGGPFTPVESGLGNTTISAGDGANAPSSSSLDIPLTATSGTISASLPLVDDGPFETVPLVLNPEIEPSLEGPVATITPSGGDNAREISPSISGSLSQTPAPPTSIVTATYSTETLPVSSVVITPLQEGDGDDEEGSNGDSDLGDGNNSAPVPVIETLPPAAEATPTESEDPLPEESGRTANVPNVSSSETTSSLATEAITETPAPTTPSEESDDDEERAENVETIQQDPILQGPDDQNQDEQDVPTPVDSNDRTGSDENDDAPEDNVFIVDTSTAPTEVPSETLPSEATVVDGPAATAEPSQSKPIDPDPDRPGSEPFETGTSDLFTDEGQPKPAVIAGSVVGAVLALALLLGLLFWYLKRRAKNHHKYVIKTPVFQPPPKPGGSEKTWDFDTGSIGPTARSARIAEAMSNHWHALGKFLKPTTSASTPDSQGRSGHVDLVGDTLPPPAHSRHNSARPEATRNTERLDQRNPFVGWWHGKTNVAVSNTQAVPRRHSSEISLGHGTRRPLDPTGSSTASEDFARALGSLLNKVRAADDDPFSDDNAVRQNPPPPPRHSSSDPFADLWTVERQDERFDVETRGSRPRGSTTGSISPASPFVVPRPWAAPLETRSNVRSDQFDLEIDGHRANLSLNRHDDRASVQRPANVFRPTSNGPYRAREVSLLSLEDTLDGWGEPGPDVGPGSISRVQYQGQHPHVPPHIGEAI